MRTPLVAAALLVALASTPATATGTPPPQATDPCGDGGTSVVTPRGVVVLEGAGPGQDLRSAALRVVRPREGGAVLLGVLGTCGPASAEADYVLSWAYADGCTLSLVRTRTVVGDLPSTSLTQTCPGGGSAVEQEAGRRTVRTALPDAAFALAGDTAVFRVPLDAVPEADRGRLAPGAVWRTTTASAAARPVAVGELGGEARVGDVVLRPTVTVRRDDLAGGGGTVEQPQA